MRRFLFLTWNGAGNQPPAIAIAQALRARGHEAAAERRRGCWKKGLLGAPEWLAAFSGSIGPTPAKVL